MKKSIFYGATGVVMVSSAAHAISVTGEAGGHYTNLGVGFSAPSHLAWPFRVTGCTAITTATPRV
ncbi:YfaZ family protein [Klebsiella pneumoniae subsp. pneumoniae]|nr:YfaZ family protein [Klebsiella pneumoniae subsp. pneumoniae]